MEFEKNQRTFPLSFWFFVSTFVKTVSSLKKKFKPGTRGSFDSKSIQKTGTRRFCNSEIQRRRKKLNQRFFDFFKKKKTEHEVTNKFREPHTTGLYILPH
jgi:hypothetical protein